MVVPWVLCGRLRNAIKVWECIILDLVLFISRAAPVKVPGVLIWGSGFSLKSSMSWIFITSARSSPFWEHFTASI